MEEALSDAVSAEKSLPFTVEWSEVGLIRFVDSSLWKDSDDAERDVMTEFEWTWVATLNARGRNK